MAHRLSRRAQDDSDDTWLYLARESGSEAVTDRMVDTLTERFTLLAQHPKLGRARDDELGAGSRSFSRGQLRDCVPHRRRRLIATAVADRPADA